MRRLDAASPFNFNAVRQGHFLKRPQILRFGGLRPVEVHYVNSAYAAVGIAAHHVNGRRIVNHLAVVVALRETNAAPFNQVYCRNKLYHVKALGNGERIS